MARRNNSTITAAGKLGILLAIFGVPAIFFGISFGLQRVIDFAPYVTVVVVLVVCAGYVSHVTGLLYDFYEVNRPLWRFIPCVGELALMTRKYMRIGIILYCVAIMLLGFSVAPYSVTKLFGQGALQAIPFYMMLGSLFILLVLQIVKGIGMAQVFKDVEECWVEQVHTRLGLINKYKPLLFIPFVRMLGLYGLAKPLETLVTFNDRTINSETDLLVDDEEYNDDDYEEEEV